MITNRRCIMMSGCKGPIVVPGKNVLNCVGIMNFFSLKKILLAVLSMSRNVHWSWVGNHLLSYFLTVTWIELCDR